MVQGRIYLDITSVDVLKMYSAIVEWNVLQKSNRTYWLMVFFSSVS